MTSQSASPSHVLFPRYSTPSSIIVGNGSILPVTATGSTELSPALRLNNVLVSPQIIKKLPIIIALLSLTLLVVL